MARERKYKYAPDKVFPPGETLREVLEEIGMSEAEFAGRMAADVKEMEFSERGSPYHGRYCATHGDRTWRACKFLEKS